MKIQELVESVRTIISSEETPYDFPGCIEEDELSKEDCKVIISKFIEYIKE